MMKLIHMAIAAFGYVCAATALAQAVFLYLAWQKGVLADSKRQQIAAIAYGFDISRWSDSASKPADRPPINEQERFDRVVNSPALLLDRRRAAVRATEDLRGESGILQIDRERYDMLKKSFSDYLDELESKVESEAIGEMRNTLAVLPPKQSKNLILQMLAEPNAEEAMTDLLKALRSMPLDRTKKIFAEFKSDEEAQSLHQILVELGDLTDRVGAG